MKGEKMSFKNVRKKAVLAFIAVLSVSLCAENKQGGVSNQQSAAESNSRAQRQADARAKRMIQQALSMVESGEDERAIGMLEAVPKMFAESQMKYKAYLELGRIHMKKGRNDEAIAQLRNTDPAKDRELLAESLLLQAKVHISSSRASEASMILRRITTDFPDSLFANDAWYEIGQIHFKGKRWFRAQEAFARVGTSVPETDASREGEVKEVLVEAGQRLYVVVDDRDLAVVSKLGGSVKVKVISKNGDSETLNLNTFGQNGVSAMASISTTTEVSKPEDGVLTVQGGEVVEIVYVEQADSKGASNIKHVASMRIVSSAVLAVMDGAYRQNVKGVFADNPAFLRLKDIDLDITSGKDSVKVTVKSFRKRQKKEDGAADAFEADEDPWEEVASGEVVLTETADRNGVFEGRVIPVLSMISGEGQIEAASDGKLVISYRDERHINGSVPREVMAEVAVLTGGSTEPQSIVSSAADPVMQCRKLLLEAKLLNQWGTIFKDVGLDKQAAQKANEGLERVDEIFSLAKRFALPRDILENTYAAKWDLYMVKGELRRAIGVCRDLLKKYPDTVLADVALLKIAKARSESRELSEIKESASIYRSVLSMPNSRNKPEAQFLLAGVLEKLAKIEAVQRRRIKDKLEPDYTAAILAYRACAENYPQSSFAGESFKRIVTFQIGKRDYDRANETLERVFQDYPDAPWLDEMLLRWGIVKYRTGDVEGAKAKFRRILEEYPAGPASSQAQNFLQKLNR